jgi:thiol-disulfide isomerase/thioredoxin
MSEDIKKLEEMVSLTDESLLSNYDYFKYISYHLIAEDSQDTDLNSKSLAAISKLKAGSFKDKILYKQLDKSLRDASNSKERSKLVAEYASLINNKKYRAKIHNSNRILESLSTSSPAPVFAGLTTDEKTISLADFRGRYVAIDVWATWCGPCKRQSPYFEKFALKYKTQPIQFIAVSIDERKDKWFIEAKSKSQSVLQLHSNDSKSFGEEYNILSIPRFILIDPAGNFINAEMPFPELSAFEILLRNAMNLPDEK